MNRPEHLTPDDVATLLRHIRKREGWSRLDTSMLTGCATSTVDRYENGEGLDQFCKILKWLVMGHMRLSFDGQRWTIQRDTSNSSNPTAAPGTRT